jgi:hypothetical protein
MSTIWYDLVQRGDIWFGTAIEPSSGSSERILWCHMGSDPFFYCIMYCICSDCSQNSFFTCKVLSASPSASQGQIGLHDPTRGCTSAPGTCDAALFLTRMTDHFFCPSTRRGMLFPWLTFACANASQIRSSRLRRPCRGANAAEEAADLITTTS